MQGGLEEPLVILDAVAQQVGLHLGDVGPEAEGGQGVETGLLVCVRVAVAVRGVEGLGQLLDVVAVVAVLREGNGVLALEDLEVAGLDGDGELMDLVAGVVDVELLPGVAAVPPEDVGQGVAQHAAAGVAHVHGAGGVGGDELHHHFFPVALVALAVEGAFLLDLGQHVAVPLVAQAEVQEAGAGDLHGGEDGAGEIHVVHQGLGNGAGGHLHGLGPGHGHGGGVVAVLGVLGDLHGAFQLYPGGEGPGRDGRLVGLGGQLADLSFCRLNQIRHNACVTFSFLFKVPGPGVPAGPGWVQLLGSQRRFPR